MAVRNPIAPPATSGRVHAGPALSLGIGATLVGAAVWIYPILATGNRVNDVLHIFLSMIGFVLSQFAIVLALYPASRPRRPGLVAAFIRGLVGFGLVLLYVFLFG